MYSEFHEWLEVYVRVWGTMYATRHRCKALGHQFFRCGKCHKGMIEVFTEFLYDEACPICGHEVIVRREKANGNGGYREEG